MFPGETLFAALISPRLNIKVHFSKHFNNNNKVYLNCKNKIKYKLNGNKLKLHTVAGHPK